MLSVIIFRVLTNYVCFYLVYLWFSSERFEGYENSGSLCITVTHNRPAMSDTTIEILEDSGTATSKFLATIFGKLYIRAIIMVQISYKLNVFLTWRGVHESTKFNEKDFVSFVVLWEPQEF